VIEVRPFFRCRIRMWRRVCAAALFSTMVAVSASVGIATREPIVHPVLIEGTSFTPQSLTVTPGDTIVWTNRDPFPHTVTARNGQFDSRIIAEEHSWTYTAKRKGEFPYFCALRQTMTGVLIVK
jgi:plastocyanin